MEKIEECPLPTEYAKQALIYEADLGHTSSRGRTYGILTCLFLSGEKAELGNEASGMTFLSDYSKFLPLRQSSVRKMSPYLKIFLPTTLWVVLAATTGTISLLSTWRQSRLFGSQNLRVDNDGVLRIGDSRCTQMVCWSTSSSAQISLNQKLCRFSLGRDDDAEVITRSFVKGRWTQISTFRPSTCERELSPRAIFEVISDAFWEGMKDGGFQ